MLCKKHPASDMGRHGKKPDIRKKDGKQYKISIDRTPTKASLLWDKIGYGRKQKC
jgi:hypothetical protein